jgi:hypothetical protein
VFLVTSSDFVLEIENVIKFPWWLIMASLGRLTASLATGTAALLNMNFDFSQALKGPYVRPRLYVFGVGIQVSFGRSGEQRKPRKFLQWASFWHQQKVENASTSMSATSAKDLYKPLVLSPSSHTRR